MIEHRSTLFVLAAFVGIAIIIIALFFWPAPPMVHTPIGPLP